MCVKGRSRAFDIVSTPRKVREVLGDEWNTADKLGRKVALSAVGVVVLIGVLPLVSVTLIYFAV